MNIILIVLIVLVVAVLVAVLAVRFVRGRWSSAAPTSESGAKPKKTTETEELYKLAMNPGIDGIPLIYAMETCRHCRRTKEFLDLYNIRYHTVYVDQYVGEERQSLMDKVRAYNPRGSFPTCILPNGKVIVGYREQLIREEIVHAADTPRAS